MAVNKVIYNNDGTPNVLIDLTGDTATASDVAQGKTFHLASGVQTVGTASGGTDFDIIKDKSIALILSKTSFLKTTNHPTLSNFIAVSSYDVFKTSSYANAANILYSGQSCSTSGRYYWYSTATDSHIGESVFNHMTYSTHSTNYWSIGALIGTTQSASTRPTIILPINTAWIMYRFLKYPDYYTDTKIFQSGDFVVEEGTTSAVARGTYAFTVVDAEGIILKVASSVNDLLTWLRNTYEFPNGAYIVGNGIMSKGSSTITPRLYFDI